MKKSLLSTMFCLLLMTALSAGEPAEIILTRHGKTHWNAIGKWQGTRDSRLNLDGVQQALEKAKLYQDIQVAAVYSSPRKRAFLTAQIIAAVHDLDVIIDDRLAESWQGILEGMYKKDIHALIDDRLNAMTHEERINTGYFTGLMSPKMVTLCVEQTLKEIGEKHPGKKIIVVSHSGIIEAILSTKVNAIHESINMTNMACMKFVCDGQSVELKEISPDITYKTYTVK